MDNEQHNAIEELAKQERLAYYRNWRANNKEKVREINNRYWKRRAEKRLQEAGKECS